MTQDGFELRVVDALEGGDAEVAQLKHGQLFRLFLANRTETPCDVFVKIDGLEIGVWSVGSQHETLFDHGQHDVHPFRFVRHDSPEDQDMTFSYTHASRWIAAMFVPHRSDRTTLPLELQARGVQPKPSHFDDRTVYDVDALVYLEIQVVAEPVPVANYQILPYLVVACASCQQEARVPKGLGHIRVTCPQCSLEYIRYT